MPMNWPPATKPRSPMAARPFSSAPRPRRRALVAAVQPEGSADVVMLVGSSTANAWKKAEPNMRAMAGSFRIAKLRKTSIARKSKNDYRFEDQGGLNEKAFVAALASTESDRRCFGMPKPGGSDVTTDALRSAVRRWAGISAVNDE